MKWIIFTLCLLPASAVATIINYEFSGDAQRIHEPDRYSLFISASIDIETGRINNASGSFLGEDWFQSSPDQYVYQAYLSPDIGILMHWLQWSLELTNGTDVLRFSQYAEWKVPSLGDNPLNRLETSVAIIGFMYRNDEPFGAGLYVAKVPEPGTLSLLALGLVAMGMYRIRR